MTETVICKTLFRPENVPRLFDLVKVKEPDVLPAFYFALRDTLVAKDLEQATRIAYGKTRYRVVTLGGQLIDTSGTVSTLLLFSCFERSYLKYETVIMNGIMTEGLVIREIRIDEAAGCGDSDSRMTSFKVIMPLKLQSTKILIYST